MSVKSVLDTLKGYEGSKVIGRLDLDFMRERNQGIPGCDAFINFLERQGGLKPEVSTVVSWVVRGQMALSAAFDLVEVVTRHRPVTEVKDSFFGTHVNQGYIFGYKDVEATFALHHILSSQCPTHTLPLYNAIGVYDKEGLLYEKYAFDEYGLQGSDSGFRVERTSVKQEDFRYIVDHERPNVILSDWDASPESLSALSTLPQRKNGVNVLARLTDEMEEAYFNAFAPMYHDIPVYLLYRDSRGMYDISKDTLSAIQTNGGK